MITKHYFWISLEKQPTSLLIARMFRQERCLCLNDKNSIMTTQINVYIINPVATGYQKYIVDSFDVKFLLVNFE